MSAQGHWGMDPMDYRDKVIMPKGFVDGFSKNENYYDSFRMCLEKGAEAIDYRRKVQEYAKDTGPVRRGIGLAAFWYNTAVYPISLETSSNRMQLNLDGTVTMQCGETEIGQGADTAYAQMTAEVIGPQELPGRPCGELPGYRHHPHRPRRLRLPPDLRCRLLHTPDGRTCSAKRYWNTPAR